MLPYHRPFRRISTLLIQSRHQMLARCLRSAYHHHQLSPFSYSCPDRFASALNFCKGPDFAPHFIRPVNLDMDKVDQDNSTKPGETVELDHRIQPSKVDVDYEASPEPKGTVDQDPPSNNGTVEYPSTMRRTAIVTGVALALFCVKNLSSIIMVSN